MKFKLLHVRPHVWFFKKETLAKATSDDSSTEAPFAYKRSTSLKLVKSVPSVDISKSRGTPLDVKQLSTNTGLSDIGLQNQGKDVRVCTVVDAGCTCRATVTSQHKQKRAAGAHPNARGDVGSIHDVCRPRRTQILEARGNAGSIHDACRPRRMHLDVKHNPDSSPSLGTSSSVMSRLVCKSSHDVVKHSQLNVINGDVVYKSLKDESSKQFDAVAPCLVSTAHNKASLDVHELECRLRSVGLEERRRSSKKKNKLYYEEGSLTSSSISTSANTDTLMTGTTSEMQDMLLNANPAFDTASMDDNMFSLEDLRASIAQSKLTNHSVQASPCAKDAGPIDGMSGSVACSESLSFGSETVKVACTLSPPCMRNHGRQLQREKPEVSVKHVDAGVNNEVYLSECEDQPYEGLRCRASGNTPSKTKDVSRDECALPRRTARRTHLSMRKGEGELEKSSANRTSVQGGVHGDTESDVIALGGRICNGFEDDIGQEKQVVSSSSCEIQVLSDYNYSDDNHAHPTMRSRISSLSTHAGAPTHAVEMTTLGHELMRSESAVAMVKSSYDPKRDFKESMLEMVLVKRLRGPQQLQQLLQCYLSLNPSHYHPTIIKVFHELCSELFN